MQAGWRPKYVFFWGINHGPTAGWTPRARPRTTGYRVSACPKAPSSPRCRNAGEASTSLGFALMEARECLAG